MSAGNIKYMSIGPCHVLFGTSGSEVDLGWTQGNVKVGVDTQLTEIEVDQETDPVMVNITKRPVSVTCPFAHYTLELLNLALPGSTLFTNKATLTTNLTGENNDLVFTAKTGGARIGPGNDIAVRYINPGATTVACTVAVSELTDALKTQEIAVTLKHDGTDITALASDVKTAIENSAAAAALVTVAYAGSDTGAGVVTAMASTNLTGGKQKLAVTSAANERLTDYAKSLKLHPTDRDDDDHSMDLWFPSAVAVGKLELTYEKVNPKLISIEFRPFPGSDGRTWIAGDPTTTEV